MTPSQTRFPLSRARRNLAVAGTPGVASIENGVIAVLIAIVLFLTMTDASARLPGLSFVSDSGVSHNF